MIAGTPARFLHSWVRVSSPQLWNAQSESEINRGHFSWFFFPDFLLASQPVTGDPALVIVYTCDMVLLPYAPGSCSAFFQPTGSGRVALSRGLTLAASLLSGVWYL